MKDRIEICKKCEMILDKVIKQSEILENEIYRKIEKFIIENNEVLKNEKEYQVLMMKYILVQERKK